MRIGIIGGGFSGVALAAHLLASRTPPSEIVIIEPQDVLGRGIAYSTESDSHLLNVPVGRMSMFPDRMDDFRAWTEAAGIACDATSFVPRRAYGIYLKDRLDQLSAQSTTILRHRRTDAVSAERRDGGWHVGLAEGPPEDVDRLVLATGNRLAGWPVPADQDDRLLVNPWHIEAERIPSDARVLLVGSGLTMIDVALSLDDVGHKGKIVAVSRHGWLPAVAREPRVATPATLGDLPVSLTALYHELRLRAAALPSSEWRAVIDGLRQITQDIWLRFSEEDKRRFLRHLRSLWDVHRHRMAPEISDRVTAMLARRHLSIRKARLERIVAEPDCVALLCRNGNRIEGDIAINCTGISSAYRPGRDLLLDSLAGQGLVAPDPLGLGLDVRPDGSIADGLYALGPPTRGMLWEITAVPDIRKQVAALAERMLAERLPA